MSALAKLVELLENRAKAKEQAAPPPASKNQNQDPPSRPRNPNAERFAHLHNDEEFREASATSRTVEKPRELHEMEAAYGKGIAAGRIIRAIACAQKYHRHEDPTTGAIKVIRDRYRDPALSKWMEGAIEKDLSANIPNEGGYLIPEVVYDEVVDLLYPKVVVLKLGATEIPMDAGNLHMNYVDQGTTAQYVGEGDTPTTTDVKFGQASWRSKKLISIIPISNDLLKVPSAKADRAVLRDAIKQMAIRMNKAAFNDDGSGNTPRGLKFEQNLTTVSLSGVLTSDNPIDFMAQLEDQLIDLDSMINPGWCFNHKLWAYIMKLKDLNGQYYYRNTGFSYSDSAVPGQANGYFNRTFESYPYATTQLIPTTGGSNPYTTDMYFGDWSEFWIPRQGMLEVDSSDVAAYNTGPSTVASAYSKDQTVLRLIDRHDMGMRQRKAMARASVTFNQ